MTIVQKTHRLPGGKSGGRIELFGSSDALLEDLSEDNHFSIGSFHPADVKTYDSPVWGLCYYVELLNVWILGSAVSEKIQANIESMIRERLRNSGIFKRTFKDPSADSFQTFTADFITEEELKTHKLTSMSGTPWTTIPQELHIPPDLHKIIEASAGDIHIELGSDTAGPDDMPF